MHIKNRLSIMPQKDSNKTAVNKAFTKLVRKTMQIHMVCKVIPKDNFIAGVLPQKAKIKLLSPARIQVARTKAVRLNLRSKKQSLR